MDVCVLEYGRLWSTRTTKDHRPSAYYNTTGIVVRGTPRPRSCIYGYIRIDQCIGFRPESADRTLGTVYETEGVVPWNGARKIFLRRLQPKGTVPDRYLVRVSESSVGFINRQACWLCDTGEILSFSEGNDQQEALIVLPRFGWVRGASGSFCLIANFRNPSIAKLTLMEERP